MKRRRVTILVSHGLIGCRTPPLIHLFSTQPRTLYNLLDVRALLEGESARLAATLGTQADLL
ncbi:hypothetical protein ACNKHM_17595 [Shigella sonnei]